MNAPSTCEELRDAVLAAPKVIPVGARTKPRLSETEAVPLSTLGLRGIITYDPGEFTFTALAGTPVAEIRDALAEHGQHLPFDPMLVEAGSTIGGAVASGLSGPGRFRYGGVRDFILGVRMVDGTGRLLTLGGKVVKNAAGFDVPKFLVGSLGRFGVIGEVTFKVFPKPPAARTLEIDPGSSLCKLLSKVAASRWEADALDVHPESGKILLRLAGPEAALDPMAGDILNNFSGKIIPGTVWDELREFRWAHPGGVLVKTATTPDRAGYFSGAHISAGGSVAYQSFSGPEQVPAKLDGLTLRGRLPLWAGGRDRPAIENAVRKALDPDNRFPTLDE